jgi:hypothetical protein
LSRKRKADIGLVLMIESYDLDRLAENLAAEILNRHPRRNDGAGSSRAVVVARLVVHDG